MDFVMYVLVGAIILLYLYKTAVPVKGLRTLTAEQFQQQSQGNVLIDVREHHEFGRGRIPGAINIPLSQLERRMEEIPREKAVFLYCQSGMRSKQAAKRLCRNGYPQLAHLKGGIMAWKGPVER